MNYSTEIERFPLSIASGKAFCNRVEETNRLVQCIAHQRPVLLASPRRYGKTSLALHAIQKSNLPYANIDFFSAVDEQDIQQAILKGIGKLIASLETIPQKALSLASEILEGSKIRAALSKFGLTIEINSQKEKPANNVLDILERLEKLALRTDKKFILFFDEFQCIGEIAPDQSMEAVLRQIAQLTQSISFIFSGSNRHLLNQLFEDRKRPFYKLCERITIERIPEADYSLHIQTAAKSKWNKHLEDGVLSAIFYCSERHPYYINLLCSRMFFNRDIATEKTIYDLWDKYVLEERSSVAAEVELLSKNQRKLLTILARVDGTKSPLGNEFIQISGMSKASIDQSLTVLERHDYITKDTSGYVSLLDPLIKTVLK